MFSPAYTKYSDTFFRITAQVSPGREQGIKNLFEASVTASSETGIRTRFFFKACGAELFLLEKLITPRVICVSGVVHVCSNRY
jgi:hypothetical protein